MSAAPGWVVRRVDVTGSTNADLLADAAAGAPHGSVLVADTQTAGRGRLGRSWLTPPGSALAVSVLLRPDVAAGDRLGWLALLTGLAVLEALDNPKTKEALLKQNFVIIPTKSPEEAQQFLRDELKAWTELVKEVKIDVAE